MMGGGEKIWSPQTRMEARVLTLQPLVKLSKLLNEVGHLQQKIYDLFEIVEILYNCATFKRVSGCFHSALQSI